jgi:hypothetical protein
VFGYLIKTNTYQLFWVNVKKLVDRVTVSFILKNIETTNTVFQSLRQPKATCVSRLIRNTIGLITMLTAHYYTGKQPVLDIMMHSEYCNIRICVETIKVTGKREARKLATARNAKPWNF